MEKSWNKLFKVMKGFIILCIIVHVSIEVEHDLYLKDVVKVF